MGKKNKKQIEDFFNMTPEEQMANAELFNDVEKGEVSFLDALNYKVPTAPIAQSDYKRQIERACLGITDEKEDDTDYCSKIDDAVYHCNDDNEYDADIETTKEYIPYSSVIEDVEDVENDNDAEDLVEISTDCKYKEESASINVNETDSDYLSIDNIPRICFAYNSVVGKMLIDDGLVTTPVSVCHTSSIELDKEHIPTDKDAYATILSKIFFFIITRKHPAVIMSEDTFEIEFSLFSKINFNKFIFFKNNGFVYAYVLDEDERDNFYSVIDIYNMDDEDILRYVVGTAYASNTTHNAFMYNDEDEVESVMEARHSVKELISLIENDSETEYAGHNSSGDVLSRMRVNDLQSFVSDTYTLLEDLIGEEDEEDIDDSGIDFDDEDEEECDDDININDFPDIDMKTGTDDIDKMFDEQFSLEESNSQEDSSSMVKKIKTSDSDDDMVLPIIHRHQ